VIRNNRPALGFGLLAAFVLGLPALAPAAQPGSLSLRNSFRIGSSGVLCTAQNRAVSPVLVSMFDRGYRVVCRDAASPVGRLFALRKAGEDPVARVIANAETPITCQAPAAAKVEGLGEVMLSECIDSNQLAYKLYAYRRGNIVYIADGLGGYDSALQLGLRTMIADKMGVDVRSCDSNLNELLGNTDIKELSDQVAQELATRDSAAPGL